MFQAIAVHHAVPEHQEAFLAFCQRVIDATADAPGLLEFSAFAEAGGSRIFGLSRWESAEAFQAALPTIMSLAPDRRPEWSDRDDELLAGTLAGQPAGIDR
jgi:Antibiotic biosynthesis monooxygenase